MGRLTLSLGWQSNAHSSSWWPLPEILAQLCQGPVPCKVGEFPCTSKHHETGLLTQDHAGTPRHERELIVSLSSQCPNQALQYYTTC